MLGAIAQHYVDSAPILTYSQEVLADSPLAYWRLGDSGTTAVDSSGNGRDANLVAANPVTGLIVGDSDQGHSGRGSLLAAAWMDVSSVTVEAWIKPTSTNNNKGIVARFTSGSQDWILWCNTSSKIAWRPYNTSGSSVDLAWSTTPSNGSIYHVVGTYVSGQARLYVNATEVAQSTALSGDLRTQSANLEIAGYQASNALAGTIDEVAIYSGELSAARILAHYTNGTT